MCKSMSRERVRVGDDENDAELNDLNEILMGSVGAEPDYSPVEDRNVEECCQEPEEDIVAL